MLKHTRIVRYRLYFALFAIFLCGVLILSAYSLYSRTARVILDESLEKSHTQASSGALHVRKTLAVQFGHLERLATYHLSDIAENSAVARIIEGTYESMTPYVRSLLWIDESGRIVVACHAGIVIERGDTTKVPAHLMRACIEAEKPYVSEPYETADGEWRVFLSQPVLRTAHGEKLPAGTLLAGIDPKTLLIDIGEAPDAPAATHYMLISREGAMLSCHSKTGTDGSVTDETSHMNCDRDLEKVQALMRRGGGSEVMTGSEGHREVVSYARMDFDGTGWGLAVFSDYDYILESLISIKMYAIVIAFLGIAIILPGTSLILHLGRKRQEAEERAKYLEKEKKLLEKIREADREIGEHNRKLTALHELTTAVTKNLVLSEVIATSVEHIIRITGYDGCALLLLEENENCLKLKGSAGLPPDIVAEIGSMDLGFSLTGQVASSGEAIFVESMVADPRHKLVSSRVQGFHGYAGIPLVH
jgi:hypothetical protein